MDLKLFLVLLGLFAIAVNGASIENSSEEDEELINNDSVPYSRLSPTYQRRIDKEISDVQSELDKNERRIRSSVVTDSAKVARAAERGANTLERSVSRTQRDLNRLATRGRVQAVCVSHNQPQLAAIEADGRNSLNQCQNAGNDLLAAAQQAALRELDLLRKDANNLSDALDPCEDPRFSNREAKRCASDRVKSVKRTTKAIEKQSDAVRLNVDRAGTVAERDVRNCATVVNSEADLRQAALERDVDRCIRNGGPPPTEPPTSSTAAPSSEPSVPSEEPSSQPPSEIPPTSVPSEEPSSQPPSEAPPTSVPSEQPSSEPPSEAPPTSVPSEEPPTDAPSSEPPTSPPSTEPPATDAPVTNPPSTDAPSTEPPATDAPVTEPPSTDAPSTEPPATDAPVTDPPSTDAPSTEPPATDAPVTDPPSTDAPSTEPPATDAPVTDPPSTDAPVTDPSSTDDPSTKPPATEEPATDPPTTDDGNITTTTDPIRDEVIDCINNVLNPSIPPGTVTPEQIQQCIDKILGYI